MAIGHSQELELVRDDCVTLARAIEDLGDAVPSRSLSQAAIEDAAHSCVVAYQRWVDAHPVTVVRSDRGEGLLVLGFLGARAISVADPTRPAMSEYLRALDRAYTSWATANRDLWPRRAPGRLRRGRSLRLGAADYENGMVDLMAAWADTEPTGGIDSVDLGDASGLEDRLARVMARWAARAGHRLGSEETHSLMARSCELFCHVCSTIAGRPLNAIVAGTFEEVLDLTEEGGGRLRPRRDATTHRRTDHVGDGSAGVTSGTDSDALVQAAMSRLMGGLYIDDHHVRTERSLTWFADRHPQTFDISIADGRARVEARVPVVRASSAGPRALDRIVDAYNRQAAMAALVVDDSGTELDLVTTGYFDVEALSTESFMVFAFAAVLANWEANQRAEKLAALVGGRPAWAAHPTLGARPTPHQSMAKLDQLPMHGRAPSRYGRDVHDLVASSPLVPWEDVVAFPGGINGIFTAGGRPVSTTIKDASHQSYGNGALMLTEIPIDAEDIAGVAAGCNRAEATERTGQHMCGAWASDPEGTPVLSHVVFIPNYAAPTTPFPFLASVEWLRCQWIVEHVL